MHRLAADPVIRALILCAVGSLAVWVLAIRLDLTQPPDGWPEEQPFTTYFEAFNWWPFPFFFLLLIPVSSLTWGAFLLAWRDLVRTGVLLRQDGTSVTSEDLAALDAAIGRRRYGVYLVGLLAALIVNAIDAAEPVSVFLGEVPRQEQLDYACANPDAWTKWVFAAEPLAGTRHLCGESVDGEPLSAPASALAFGLVTLLQQVLIVFFVAVFMAQLLLHSALFGAFERLLPDMRERGLRIRLNATSPVNEFGLERWNYALNNFYWMSCPVLLLVFLSRSEAADAEFAPGQAMLAIVVPALLLAPMIVTILARQVRLPDVWARLETGDAALADSYRRQQLWPLDRNWSAKLGIILAFTLAALSLGYEVQQLVGVTG